VECEGPIHDFSFKPASTDFVLIYGFVPAIAYLYVKYEKAFDFGKTHRNLSVWSYQGQYLAPVGFDNINGEIDIRSKEGRSLLFPLVLYDPLFSLRSEVPYCHCTG
jgi:uncharacterized protein with WD repeat